MFRNLPKLKNLSPFRNFVRYNNQNAKTTAIFLNDALGAPLMINALSRSGFRLNNNFATKGSMIIFPKTVMSWNVGQVEDINEQSLSLFTILEPKLDILVIGVGDKGNRLDSKTILYMRNKGYCLEVLPTEQACYTYNFLVTEGRFVAAALLPPHTLTISTTDGQDLNFSDHGLFIVK